MNFDATGQLLTIYSASSNTWEKLQYIETVYRLFVGFKKAYDSARKEVLRNILIKFGITMKLVWLTKMFSGSSSPFCF